MKSTFEREQQTNLEELRADLSKLVGVDSIKERFEILGMNIENAMVLGLDNKRDRFHAVFQGNPGSGASDVLRFAPHPLYSIPTGCIIAHVH